MANAGWANVKPVKPGEVRNPSGINGYTYRADAERDLAKWCKKHGTELIERLLNDAKKGKAYALKLALDRILPAVHEHELRIPGIDPVGLGDELAAAAKRRRSNGSAADPHPGSNGGGV